MGAWLRQDMLAVFSVRSASTASTSAWKTSCTEAGSAGNLKDLLLSGSMVGLVVVLYLKI